LKYGRQYSRFEAVIATLWLAMTRKASRRAAGRIGST
jgi:hypothetical protein